MIEKEGTQSPRIQTAVVQPLLASVQKYEKIRTGSNAESTDSHQHELGDRLGDPLPPLASGNDDLQSASTYLCKLLSLEGRQFENADRFVTENPYLFWEIPRSILKKEGEDMLCDAHKIWEDGTLSSLRHSTAAVLDGLEQVAEAEWSATVLETGLKPIIKMIQYSDSEGEAIRPFGWKLLRWIIMAGHHGPSLVHTMAILGSEETRKRAKAAVEIASEIESSSAA